MHHWKVFRIYTVFWKTLFSYSLKSVLIKLGKAFKSDSIQLSKRVINHKKLIIFLRRCLAEMLNKTFCYFFVISDKRDGKWGVTICRRYLS